MFEGTTTVAVQDRTSRIRGRKMKAEKGRT